MAELIEIKDTEERVILLAVSTEDTAQAEDSLDELEELVATAGAVTVDRMIQNRENIHPGHLLGKGKDRGGKRAPSGRLDATGVVCDDELTPGAAAQPGGGAGHQGHGSHHGDPGHLRVQGEHQGRKDPGGVSPA